MNEEYKNEINNPWQHHEKRRSRGRVFAGLFLLGIGGLLLLKTMNILYFPGWVFTWPVILIAVGLFLGARHGFRGGIWLIPLLIGGIFLLNQLDPALRLERFTAPVLIMAIGLIFILRPQRSNWRRWRQYRDGAWQSTSPVQVPAPDMAAGSGDRRDFIDVTAVFGGVKKSVLSKNFKGGDIVSFMGGSEINLTQADFSGKITIDATNIFGGTKLIVPPTWDVQSDITAIFGGVDDKRQINGVTPDPNKLLVLDGTCMFGGIEIRSF